MIEKLKPAIRIGLIYGLITTMIFLLVWALAPEMFGSFSWLITQGVLFMLALPIVFMIIGTRDTKAKANVEHYSYGNAFKAAFTVALVASLFGLVFNIIFHTAIDPEFDSRMKEVVMETTLERLENANLDDDMIDEQMSKAEERMDNQAGVMGKVKSTLWGLVWFAILAALIAIVYKDKKTQPTA